MIEGMVLVHEFDSCEHGLHTTGRAIWLGADCPVFGLLGEAGKKAVETGHMGMEVGPFSALLAVAVDMGAGSRESSEGTVH